jgi:hypothetical protein
MALGKLQKIGVKQMTRAMVDQLGDTPRELELKQYWYELNGEKVAAEDAPNQTDLARLDEFAQTPRDTDTDFARQTVGKPPLLSKAKWADKVANAPLVYGAVVQAHSALFKPGNNANVGAVVVISTDPKRIHDVKYLRDVADKISQMKDPTNPVPDDMMKLIKVLRNDSSIFCWQVGASTADDDATWCATYAFADQSALPTNRIPDNRIVPFLLMDTPRDNVSIDLKLIPKEYYS